MSAHQRPITCVRTNRDGDLLWTASMDKTAMLWSTSNGERIGTYDGHNGALYDCDVDYNSKYLLTAGADSTVKLWAVDTGKELHTYTIDNDVAARRVVSWGCGDKIFMYTTARYQQSPCRIIIQKLPEEDDDFKNSPEPMIIPVTMKLVT